MRVLTPLLVAGCLLPGVESFTGLAPCRNRVSSPATLHRTAGIQSRPPGGAACVMIAAKAPAAAADAPAETRVDPSVVEAALVEEDKNV